MNHKILKRCEEMAYAIFHSIKWHRCVHVAFLLDGSRIRFVGWNKEKTHPVSKQHPYRPLDALHAELDVCLKPKRDDLSKYNLAVLRIDRNYLLNNSLPCPGCQSVIRQLGIRRAFFTNSIGTWEECEHV